MIPHIRKAMYLLTRKGIQSWAMYKITIHQGKEKQLLKHHPWVFTGAIESVSPKFVGADWAEVTASNGVFIAWGWYDEKSHIVLHLLSWDKGEEMGEKWVRRTVFSALEKRKDLFNLEGTNAFRLIHGEADFLPGIAVDAYGRELSAIISSRFANDFLDVILSSLFSALSPERITVRTDSAYASAEGLKDSVSVYGKDLKRITEELGNMTFQESGIWYESERGKSQKSGFYCDQRDNRNIAESFASGKKVLDLCSYTGSFTLHCLRGGAKSVKAIDSSESALRHLLYQIHLNENKGVLPEGSREKVEIKSGDVFQVLREEEDGCYDMIILDPPKLANTKSKAESALKAYKDLNRVAMQKLRDGGILCTFSCTGAVDAAAFRMQVAYAASDNGYEAQVLRTLSAGEDHPVRLSFPESEYLKGLVLRIIK